MPRSSCRGCWGREVFDLGPTATSMWPKQEWAARTVPGTACTQVPAPIGPYKGGSTARISKNQPKGCTHDGRLRLTVDAGCYGRSDRDCDVVFLDGDLYAVVAGGGCSHGHPDSPTGIAKVDPSTGNWKLIADIGSFLKAHPTKYESADDFEPDGTLYSVIAVFGKSISWNQTTAKCYP